MGHQEIYNVIRDINFSRRVPEREILSAIHNSEKYAWKMTSASKPLNEIRDAREAQEARAKKNLTRRLDNSFTCKKLLEGSPDHPADIEPHELLAELFPGKDTLICLSDDFRGGKVNRRELVTADYQGPHELLPESDVQATVLRPWQFIVPNPMKDHFGKTQEGKKSPRCIDNVRARWYAVVEFDEGSMDQQARCLKLLSEAMPLTMVVFSGSKSLHGWFLAKGEKEERIARFYKLAIALGADPATRSLAQMVRLPWGVRDNGHTQSVYYLDRSNMA